MGRFIHVSVNDTPDGHCDWDFTVNVTLVGFRNCQGYEGFGCHRTVGKAGPVKSGNLYDDGRPGRAMQ